MNCNKRNNINVKQLLLKLERKGIRLRLDGGEIYYSAQSKHINAEILNQIKTRKIDIINYLKQRPIAPTLGDIQLDSNSLDVDRACFPLSYAQKSFWTLEEQMPDNTYSILINSILVLGEININAFKQAFSELINKHKILSTVIRKKDGEPRQEIKSLLPYELEVAGINNTTAEERKEEIANYIINEYDQPFNLERGPLFRAKLMRITDDQAVIVLTIHHIICDGWSLELLNKELINNYNSICENKALPDTISTISMGQFALWQQQMAKTGYWDKELDYWKNKLALKDSKLLPKSEKSEANRIDFGVKRIKIELLLSDVKMINQIKSEASFTNMMVFIFILKLLLRAWTDKDNVRVGILSATRIHDVLESSIGLFMNTLVLSTNIENHLTLREALEKVRSVILEAYNNQMLPFEYLLEQLNSESELNHSGLFSVMLLYHPFSKIVTSNDGVRFQRMDMKTIENREHLPTSFDLIVAIQEKEKGIMISATYKKSVFKEQTMVRFVDDFKKIIGLLNDKPDSYVYDLNRLGINAIQDPFRIPLGEL